MSTKERYTQDLTNEINTLLKKRIKEHDISILCNKLSYSEVFTIVEKLGGKLVLNHLNINNRNISFKVVVDSLYNPQSYTYFL